MTAPNNTKVATLTLASNGDNTVVAAVSGTPIVVWAMFLTTHGAVTVTFYDGASPTTPLGAYEFTAAGTMALDNQNFPLFRTTIGNAFIMNLSSGVQINGTCYYSLA